MGSWSELRLGAFYLGCSKDEIDPTIMTLYRESDKEIRFTNPEITEGEQELSNENYEEDSASVIKYTCSVAIAKDRLELLGFTIDVAEAGYNRGLRAKIESYEESARSLTLEFYRDQLNILRDLTLENWLCLLKDIQKKGLKQNRFNDPSYDKYSPILQYMLRDDWYGFPGYDHRHVLRLELETCEDDEQLVYDVTDLHNGGYINGAADLIDYAERMISEDFTFSRRIIVLTEGKSDRWVLNRSIKILYPHLVDYFHFLDFDGARIGGGAGALVNTVKAFVGAGIINRILAIFDNDTAAESALRGLNDIELPDNISIIKYPSFDLAHDYPTIGPTGVVEMDVNGLAGSIELYLGKDVLLDEDKNLTAIQWRGYDEVLKKYQGEILNKAELLRKFDNKLSLCESDPQQIEKYDWAGIRAIISAILTSFHNKQAQQILRAEWAY